MSKMKSRYRGSRDRAARNDRAKNCNPLDIAACISRSDVIPGAVTGNPLSRVAFCKGIRNIHHAWFGVCARMCIWPYIIPHLFSYSPPAHRFDSQPPYLFPVLLARTFRCGTDSEDIGKRRSRKTFAPRFRARERGYRAQRLRIDYGAAAYYPVDVIPPAAFRSERFEARRQRLRDSVVVSWESTPMRRERTLGLDREFSFLWTSDSLNRVIKSCRKALRCSLLRDTLHTRLSASSASLSSSSRCLYIERE